MATQLGVAYVSILPETSRLVPEFNRQVGTGMEQSGRQQGQRYGNAFSASAGKLIGAASGLVAGAAIGSFIKQSIADVQRVEKLAAQTSAVIKSTGGAAQVSAGHVADLADEIERMTSIEAENVTEGANFLLTFKNIKNEAGNGNDVFDQTIRAMTDMSTAMGTDAKTAALQLGKALNDPVKGVGALAKVGVGFTDQQKEQIKTLVASNDLLGAQKIILAELNSQFGGSAEALGNTTAGSIAKAQNALGNFGEEIVGNVMPAINGIASALVPVFDVLTDNTDLVLGIGAAFLALKFVPPIFAQIGGAASASAARVGAFATAVGYAQTAAGRTTANVGRLSAAMQVASQQGGNVGRIGTAFTNAAGSASRFSTAAGAAAGASKALSIAGGGILSALGGPFGVAMIAASAALFVWIKRNQEAKAAAEAHDNAVKSIADTLNSETGAVTKATEAAVAKELADKKLIESAQNYGISANDLIDAHLGQASALGKANTEIDRSLLSSVKASDAFARYGSIIGVSADEVARALRGNADDTRTVENAIARLAASGDSTVLGLNDFRESLDQSGRGALDLSDSLGKSNTVLDEARRKTNDTALAMSRGAETSNNLSDAMDKISDSASTAEDRTNALKQAIDALNGNPLDFEQTSAALSAAYAATADALKPQGGQPTATVNVDTNTIDTATEAGRRFLDVTIAQRDATLDNARAAADAANALGDFDGANRRAADIVAQSRQKFLEQAAAIGVTGVEAERLADKYIGIPSEVATLINQPGMGPAQIALDILKGKVDLVPGDKAITVETLDDAARAKLETLEFTVTNLRDGRVEVSANTTQAEDAIKGLIAPKTVPIDLRVSNPEEFRRQIDAASAATGRRVNPGAYADGGPVTGGVPGRDSVPALLMPGEHVLTTSDVARLGGQAGAYRFREALATGQVGRYANGGAVERAKTNARADNGLSYIWGDRDCSMFMSWIHSDLMGTPRQRLYTTYSLLDGAAAGLKPGPGSGDTHFLVGVNREHMAGTLDGVNVEAGGAGGNVQYGGQAAGAFDPQFTNIFHLPDSLLNPPPSVDAAMQAGASFDTNPTTGSKTTNPTTGSTTTSPTPESSAGLGSTPSTQAFSLTDRLKKFGADLSSVAVDALMEQLPFDLGQSRWLTTPLPDLPAPSSFPAADLAKQQPVTTGAPNWADDLLKAVGAKANIPIFDQGGIVPPGLNLINNKTGAPEALANVTGLLNASPITTAAPAKAAAEYHFHVSDIDEALRKHTIQQQQNALAFMGR